MNVLVVSGIWPPDVGGPAVHAPAVAAYLQAAGHGVVVLTTADKTPAREEYPVYWTSRNLPAGVRHVGVVQAVARRARAVDVVYATSMVRRSVAGARLARTPIVVKLVADEAFERARRSGRFAGTLEEFQDWRGPVSVRLLRATRTAALRRARHVFVPSEYLREIALRWGLDSSRVSVLPNAAPELPPLPTRDEARRALGIGAGFLLGFAGRLTVQKALPTLLEAVAAVPAATLVLLGDGPERAALEQQAATLGLGTRVQFLGGGSREDVLRLFRAADVAVLPSAWENFPHTVVEALAVGTPVLATSVGGVPEVVTPDVNGVLVAAGDAHALRAAISRLAGDPDAVAQLAAGAAPSVAHLAEERLLGTVAAVLQRVSTT